MNKTFLDTVLYHSRYSESQYDTTTYQRLRYDTTVYQHLQYVTSIRGFGVRDVKRNDFFVMDLVAGTFKLPLNLFEG